MTHLFARTEVYDWVERDEALREWWLRTGQNKRDFIHNNRKVIEAKMNFEQAEDYTCLRCGKKRWVCDQCKNPNDGENNVVA